MNVRRAATLSGFNGVEKELNQTVLLEEEGTLPQAHESLSFTTQLNPWSVET